MPGPASVALVGCGYWGRNLARNFAELGALAAVVDSHGPTLDQVTQATGAAGRTFAEVLADPAITGVAIATRAETHFSLAEAALRAGKHVYVEKPLTLDAGEAAHLIAVAEGQGRILMVGHLLRYHPLFQRFMELVRSNACGQLRHVYSDRLSLGKVRTEENVLWSFLVHDISMILALAGGLPDKVTASGTAILHPSLADCASVQMTFPSGLTAEARGSWLNPRKVQQIVAICDEGAIVFEDSEPEWTRKLAIHPVTFDRVDGIPVPKRGEVIYPEVPRQEPLRLECQEFLDCLATGRQPLTGGREGLDVLTVLMRADSAMAAN